MIEVINMIVHRKMLLQTQSSIHFIGGDHFTYIFLKTPRLESMSTFVLTPRTHSLEDVALLHSIYTSFMNVPYTALRIII